MASTTGNSEFLRSAVGCCSSLRPSTVRDEVGFTRHGAETDPERRGFGLASQPERINAYAQAVIRTLQAAEHQRGCLMEERVLRGDLAYQSLMPRLAGGNERFVLLALRQTLVERGFPSPEGERQ